MLLLEDHTLAHPDFCAQGVKIVVMAPLFGVCPTTISRAANRRGWRNV